MLFVLTNSRGSSHFVNADTISTRFLDDAGTGLREILAPRLVVHAHLPIVVGPKVVAFGIHCRPFGSMLATHHAVKCRFRLVDVKRGDVAFGLQLGDVLSKRGKPTPTFVVTSQTIVTLVSPQHIFAFEHSVSAGPQLKR